MYSVEYCEANTGDGGVFYATSTGSNTMTINNSIIKSSYASKNGGYFYSKSGLTSSIVLSSATLTNSTSGQSGGFFYIDAEDSLTYS